MASSRHAQPVRKEADILPWRTGFDTVERVETLKVELHELYRELNVSAQA
jgi:hypothetical protein